MTRARPWTRLLPAFLAAAACGCMGPFEVQVVHILPDDRETAFRLVGLEPLYVEVVRRPRPAAPPRPADPALIPDVRAARLAAAVAGALRDAGVRVSAFSAETEESAAGRYAEATGSAGVLRVTVVSAEVSARPQGTCAAVLVTRVLLLDAATGQAADDLPMDVGIQARLPVGKPLSSWYEENEKMLFGVLARKLAARYGGRLVVRHRPVLSTFDAPESEQAMRAARKGNWKGAAAVWSQRALSGAGDWRDWLDLGVAAERQSRWGPALELYQKARAGGQADPEGAVLPWDQMDSDLKWAIVRSSFSARAGAWFSGRVAVLPLERPKGAGDGPDLVRDLVAEALRRGGYDAQPADDAEAAARLGADRLLKGRLDEFNDAALGARGKGSVAGGLSLWDVQERRDVWSARESLADVQGGLRRATRAAPASAPADPALRERLVRSPLGYEIQLFVERCLESLPMRGRAD